MHDRTYAPALPPPYAGLVQTRHVIAIAQMLTSSLLIAVTGGRIESNSHIFAALHLGASIGTAPFPSTAGQKMSSFITPTGAMDSVKQQGRRGFHFCGTPEPLTTGALGDLAPQHAIDNDHLELHVQPLVDVSTTITAFEALVRWRCPKRGLIAPVEFIDAAGKSGQIAALGRVVLDKAVQQAAAWLSERLNLGHITVNVSPKQLMDCAFVFHLERLMKQHHVPASAVCLECSGSACASNAEVQTQLQDCARGIRIYVDDFGTGYSSLGRLREMSFDVIRIDRCFIQRLTTDETGGEIVSLVISFGRLLGMTVVAEGVETAEQFEALRAPGCDQTQGYFISRPMMRADATAFLKQHQASEPMADGRRMQAPRPKAPPRSRSASKRFSDP
jgi:EAL domain-containing protein (putative c-di-GMP-specific phosphodiesterase class I)